MLKLRAFVFCVPLVLAAGGLRLAFAQPSLYVVDGLALGSRIRLGSDAYSQYQCGQSDTFAGFVWCHKEQSQRTRRAEVNTSNSLLHAHDGTVVYVNHYLDPAFFSPNEVRNEINRLSKRFGEDSRQLKMPRRKDLPNAVIALWGGVRLEQLTPADVSILANGGNPHQGILISFLGDLRLSAKANVPVYHLTGGAGFVWAAAFNKNGRGVVRFLAIDGSRIPAPAVIVTPTFQGPFTWSDCELGSQNPARSIPACTKFLEGGPAARRAEAFHNRALGFRAKGELDRAISDLTQGIQLDRRHAYRFQERGEIYVELQDYRKAIADFDQAIRLDATRAFRFHWRGLAYSGIGNYELAIANFTEAIRLDPVRRSFRFYDRAKAFRELAQYDRAIMDYDEAVRLDSTNGWTFVDRGRTYRRMGQFVLARNDFERALLVPNATPELRQAVAEEIERLTDGGDHPSSPPPTPAAPSPRPVPPLDVRPQRLSDLNKIRSVIEKKLPEIHFADLHTQADELPAKLAVANLQMPLDQLDNLIGEGQELVKRIDVMDEFDRISSIATRQKKRIKNVVKNVVTDAPYMEEIADAIASLEKAQHSQNLPELQSALGNLSRV